ncbi:NAD(P)/FAD-dependent oxidoreductase [Ilyobacter polytropus]|uniref:HI0933 family protein n=1 Tax=Ilyobacter polytropus (strain ATCC 51220 / DSM 2926 / LMG 16218 / CuHBu1) TaxID=572544 RepID=E3H705_ILYPC|nr:NAD(P)/FAD-dependent oxidoreductase [Ilyobacter polytropus]ADO82524.1 HI0933 family protein [Ilyobacter polytropus DSM 2926]
MKIYDLIVIGGGPAGIFSAIYAAKKNMSVAIIEKKNNIGKKILVAGSGKCNVTHQGEINYFLNRYGDHGKFLKNALYNYKPEDLIDFIESKGLKMQALENGKIFPETMRSTDVLNLLIKELKKLKVDIFTNNSVISSEKKSETFKIETDKEMFSGKNLLISTGGKSYPATGSEGDGYKLAQMFGHSIEAPRPALTTVYVNDYPYADLSGVSFQKVKIELYRENKKVKEHCGDVLFTHSNLSGPGIIDFSRYFLKGDTLFINFTGKELEDISEEIIEASKTNGKQSIKRFFSRYNIPERFLKKLFKMHDIDENVKLGELSKADRVLLTKKLSKHEFLISRLGNFDVAMATAGGVSLKEVNQKTMESKLVKKLYFAGELLDIDGDTGGFNIQAACSTGVLAAKSVKV